MDNHLRERIDRLFSQYSTVTLATCGAAGPQISRVSYRHQGLNLYLFVPHSADHLFNLETQPALVLLSPGWKLHGCGEIASEVAAPLAWQMAVHIQPVCLHILSDNGDSSIETIDF
jgi:hypothetical protein